MYKRRKQLIDVVKWLALGSLIICNVLFGYFPFPESWVEIQEDGTSKADDVWYIGNALFYVFIALTVYLEMKPDLYTNLLMWVCFMMLVDRFVSPYHADKLEWVGLFLVFSTEIYRYFKRPNRCK